VPEPRLDERRDHNNVMQQPDAIPWVDFRVFNIVKYFNSGSFKTVFHGQWKKSCGYTDVAILQIRNSRAAGRREEFEREVQTFKTLGLHSNLLRLLAITTEPKSGDFCMVTEFASMGSLDTHLSELAERKTTISPLVQLQVAMQICEGMVQLALYEVVHRDLAARNVLVFSLVPQDHLRVNVKIADYGLSIMASRGYGEGAGGVSTAGSTIRPVRWLAPECIQRRRYSEKSDVWAFGVTLWEVWTYAKVPFYNTSDEEVEQKVLTGSRLSQPQSCPDQVYSIMQECWKEKQSDRPEFKDLKLKLQGQYDEALRSQAIESVMKDSNRCKRPREDDGAGEDDDNMCVICNERERRWAFLPCGHRCLCDLCNTAAATRLCPMCRAPPSSMHRIY